MSHKIWWGPIIFSHFQYRNHSFTASCVQFESKVGRSPLYVVYRALMQLMISNFRPDAIFILINSNFLSKSANCNQFTKWWISPANLPYRSDISKLFDKLRFKMRRRYKSICVPLHYKYISFWIRDGKFGSIVIILIVSLNE